MQNNIDRVIPQEVYRIPLKGKKCDSRHIKIDNIKHDRNF